MLPLSRENWLQAVDANIERVLDEAALHRRESSEWHALCYEATCLRGLREHVLNTLPAEREDKRSYLVALCAREHLQIKPDLIETVGMIYDRYRRWKTSPELGGRTHDSI